MKSAYTNWRAKRPGYERRSLELPEALETGQAPVAALAQAHLAGGAAGRPPSALLAGSVKRQFLGYLEKHPGAKVSEAAKSMGVAPSQVHGLARRLHQAGKISKRRGGGYGFRASATKS